MTDENADQLLDTLLGLETRGWESLCAGTGDDFYGSTMTSDGRMVLANGQSMARDEVVASLHGAPAWDGYDMSDVRLVGLGPDAAALVYRGTARREGQQAVVAVMTSVYVRLADDWRLALYTQTPVLGT